MLLKTIALSVLSFPFLVTGVFAGLSIPEAMKEGKGGICLWLMFFGCGIGILIMSFV